MRREFNITVTCNPAKHYMVDTTRKLDEIMTLIQKGKYFVINRPRQYGKTTTMVLLRKMLLKTDEYLPINISFEGLGNEPFQSAQNLAQTFLELISRDITVKQAGFSELFIEQSKIILDFQSLSLAITEILSKIDKKLVLMIDEVDKTKDNEIFMDFLGMLRAKYINADMGTDVTFHTIILAGVHDIKNLKRKIKVSRDAIYGVSNDVSKKIERGDAIYGVSTDTYNSPWNIAADFKVNLSFNPQEIATMLTDYCNDTGYNMDIQAICEHLYFWTSGYPFLVSKLCKMIDEEILPAYRLQPPPTPSNLEGKYSWTIADVDKAVQLLLNETNTLFDDMSKNLESNSTLFNFMQSIVLGQISYKCELSDPVINLAYIYGMIDSTEQATVKIHNKIFTEKLAYYFMSKNKTRLNIVSDLMADNYFFKNDGRLDMDRVLLKFQEGIKENIHKRDRDFLENNLRLVFLMYIKNLINGKGFSFKEVEIGEEKRLDIVVVFKDEKFIIELKIWRGQQYHEEGLKRLKQYMELSSVNKGYMLIMNNNKNKKNHHETQDDILIVYV